MSVLEDIRKIEAAFGIALPADYRQFLCDHTDDVVDPPMEFSLARDKGGVGTVTVDGLHTAAQIVAHEEGDASCDPERQMLIIGYNLMGGYLYLCYSSENFGHVFFREPYVAGTYYHIAGSFQWFLAVSRPVTSIEA